MAVVDERSSRAAGSRGYPNGAKHCLVRNRVYSSVWTVLEAADGCDVMKARWQQEADATTRWRGWSRREGEFARELVVVVSLRDRGRDRQRA